DLGAAGAVPLKVAGAFHSEIMRPAAEKFAAALEEVSFTDPQMPMVANCDAAPYSGAAEIKTKLLAQLVSPVRWQQSMEYLLAQGVGKFYEIGPGRVLAGLMRRIDRKADVTNLNSREAIEKLARQ
ncbi:MAG: ACP S-malonyltransferase, partial [Phycisphaerae bacterium]|nr:ACP S-malonyltransferase [Phycisphaerae bacterium]